MNHPEQRIAAIQMQPTSVTKASTEIRLQNNLVQAAKLIEEAVKQRASVVVLPEYFAYYGCASVVDIGYQEATDAGPARQFLAQQAKAHNIWLVGGTIPVATRLGHIHQTDTRPYASCFVVNNYGEEVACYQKMHLFDAQVNDSQGRYQESTNYRHGSHPVVVETPVGMLGLSVCYDLRFPELYRRLVEQGADILVAPSAFTANTGEAHWSLLLRARAVENLCYMVGANMGDRQHPKRPTWGGSAIVDPWGEVMGQLDDGAGMVVCNVNLMRLQQLRKKMPVHAHRRFAIVQDDRSC